MIIPQCQGQSQSQYDGANQSQSIKKSLDNDDTRFFTEVHLLAGKLVLVVTINSLKDSRAHWHHTPNSQQGATQPTQDEDHTSHEQFTKVPFGSSPGTRSRTPHNHHDRSRRQSPPPLDDPRCSKPSRWRQPPRVTSEIRSETRSLSASRCNHSSNALGSLPISL